MDNEYDQWTVFDLNQRCDQCGAHTKRRVYDRTGRSLDFCGHHFDKHASALVDQGWTFEPPPVAAELIAA